MTTAFTTLMGIRHPIALAPMGGSAGGTLAAGLSNGGGLGLVGGGRGDRAWLEREGHPDVRAGGRGPGRTDSRAGGGRDRRRAGSPTGVGWPPRSLRAGEALDLITTADSAADIVADVAAGAERALASAGKS
jgi:hypothetical protein